VTVATDSVTAQYEQAVNLPPPGVTSELVEVTPELAKLWLGQVDRQRHIHAPALARYVRDMNAGRWHYNAEPIQFDWNGMLGNGQHRLHAIVLSGISQWFRVERGLAPSASKFMDQGERRTPSELMKYAGHDEVDTSIAAATRIVIQWEQGRLFGDTRKAVPATSELVEWADAHPSELAALVELSQTVKRGVPAPPSVAIAVAFKLAQVDEQQAAEFMAACASWEMLAPGSPILAVRKRLTNARESGVRLPNRDIIGYLVIAWNAYRAGRRVDKVQKPKGGAWTAENFPVPA